jgi:ElaB/YqjD/DUF883 family membrane-anchored ribosome-binding protein
MSNDATAEGQELLKSAARNLGTLAGQWERTMQKGQEKLVDIKNQVVNKGRSACDFTDEYAHDHPYRMIITAGALGLIVGLILARR